MCGTALSEHAGLDSSGSRSGLRHRQARYNPAEVKPDGGKAGRNRSRAEGEPDGRRAWRAEGEPSGRRAR